MTEKLKHITKVLKKGFGGIEGLDQGGVEVVFPGLGDGGCGK